jgi:glycosyltransferase involved in cell wall biosynthesis
MFYIDEIKMAIETLDVDNALKLFEKHRDEHGNDPEFIAAQAILCIQTQELETARDILLDGIKKHPNNVDLLYNIGYVYQSLGLGVQALEFYNYAIENTDDADLIDELKQLCSVLKESPSPGVNLFMKNFNNSSGVVGRLMQQALEAAGIPFNVFDLCDSQKISGEIKNTELYKVNLIISNVAFVHCEISTLLSFNFGFEDFYNIGYLIWELAELPDSFCSHLSMFQEIWTLSEFCTNAIKGKISVPVLTVPLYADSNRTVQENGRDLFGVKKDVFLFMTAFDCNSFMSRKNPLAAVRAFLEAFSPNNQNIGLMIKLTYSETYKKHIESLHHLLSNYPNIYYIDKYLTDEEMRTLLYISDTYITLHRAEGFGLIPLEAMALGTPVISTAWSGNMEYMNHMNTALVGYTLIPVDGQYVGTTQGDGFVWANPDIKEASRYMQQMVCDNEWKESLIINGKNTAIEHYNVTMMSRKISDRLKTLQLI